MKKFLSILTIAMFCSVFTYAQTEKQSDTNSDTKTNVEVKSADSDHHGHDHDAVSHDGKKCGQGCKKACCSSKKSKAEGKKCAPGCEKTCCANKTKAKKEEVEETEESSD